MLHHSHLRVAALAGLLALMTSTGWGDDAGSRLRVLSYNIDVLDEAVASDHRPVTLDLVLLKYTAD